MSTKVSYHLFESGWAEYYIDLRKHAGFRRGRELFLPSPFEIEQRKYQVFWLRERGFISHEIASILQFDMPTFDKVQDMVERYGPEETRRRCRPFFVENEYTQEVPYGGQP